MDKILSIAEIGEIEQAHRHGVLSLGNAAAALAFRWTKGLRDSETAIRLMYFAWYRCVEPEFVTGLAVQLPAVEEILSELGGEEGASPEQVFVLGFLASVFPWCLGDEAEWKARSMRLLEQATRKEPTSRVFRDWQFLVGETTSSLEAETLLYREIHARFHGRGALGVYMVHMLSHRLKPSARQR